MSRPAAFVIALVAAVPSSLGVTGCSGDSATQPTTMLATAFPLGSVLSAAEVSLPEDVAIGEIPRDIRWLPGNQVAVPVVRGGEQADLVVTVLPEEGECTASSTVLSAQEEAAVGAEVCVVWDAEGRLPVVVPDPDAPLPTDPSDAAR